MADDGVTFWEVLGQQQHRYLPQHTLVVDTVTETGTLTALPAP